MRGSASRRSFAPGIRAHLVGLVFAAVVPVLAFSAVMTVVFWHQQRASFEQRFLERVRGMTIALDRELEASVRALEALAAASELDTAEFDAFAARARRMLGAEPTWATIVLVDRDGTQLVNLVHPPRDPKPNLSDRPLFQQVLATRRPAVSPLQNSLLHGGWSTGIAVPVLRGGEVRYVLGVGIDETVWRTFLARYPVAPDATMTLLDQDRMVIAHTQDQDKLVGKRPPRTLDERAALDTEGAYLGRNIDRQRVYAAHARSTVSGWTVATMVPSAGVERAIWRSVLIMGAGGMLALLLAVTLALRFGRRIAAQITTLARRATELSSGDGNPTSEAPAITEVAEVARAFDDTTAELRARQNALRAERHLAAEQLAQIEAIYRTAPVGLCVLDGSLRFVRINERLAEMNGVSVAAHIGRTVREIIPNVAETIEPMLQQVVDGGMPRIGVEFTGETPAQPGVLRTWQESWLPLRAVDGRVVGISIVAQEITERKRADEERATLLAAAQAASREAHEFLAMLGHELRNPLGAIASALHVMSAPTVSESQAASARAIARRQVGHLARLVEDLLDVSRVASGKIVLERRPVNMHTILTHSLGTLAASGQTARHEITVRGDAVWIEADETRLEQIVNNLLGNALKYTPAGGRITVDVRAEDVDAVLRVADNGAGITPENLTRIFDLFVQGPRTLDRGQGGLGIGLTLVRRLVELHGGYVAAESAGPGRGSVFTVRVPRVAAPAAPALAPAVAGRADDNRRRILIVEDNEDVREMLRQALQLAGHDVHVRGEGPAGVDAAAKLKPDVALVDIGLPGEDGYSVAGRIRKLPGGREVLLVALTGYGQADDRRRAREAGFDIHVAKPVDPFRLLEIISHGSRVA